MRKLTVLCGLLVSLAATAPATAQSYPNRQIKIVVNSVAGGPTDITARAIREHMQTTLGQPVIIENRDGAIGITGAAAVARSDPDGYTILMSGAGPMLISPLTRTSMPYDAAKDFEPVNLCVEVPVIISAHPSIASSLKELVDRAKREPGKLTFASTGVGGPAHMTGEYLKLLAGIDMIHVPYRGQPQAVLGLIAGDISMYTGTPGAVIPHGKSGALRLLAITGSDRSKDAPDVPTTAEAGYPKLGAPAFFGTFVPAQTPREIIQKIDQATQAALKDPAVIKQLETAGFIVRNWGAEKFKEYLKEETVAWGRVVKEAGIKAE